MLILNECTKFVSKCFRISITTSSKLKIFYNWYIGLSFWIRCNNSLRMTFLFFPTDLILRFYISVYLHPYLSMLPIYIHISTSLSVCLSYPLFYWEYPNINLTWRQCFSTQLFSFLSSNNCTYRVHLCSLSALTRQEILD